MNTYHAAFWSSAPSRLSSSDEEEEERDSGVIWTGTEQAVIYLHNSLCMADSSVNKASRHCYQARVLVLLSTDNKHR